MLKKLTLAVVALAVAAPMVYGAEDLSGKWSGKFTITRPDGTKNDDVAYAVVKHAGTDFGGTIGPNEDQQWAISKGKVDDSKEGTKVSFTVVHPEGNGTATFQLTLVKGHLVGKAAISGGNGESFSADVDLERVK